MEDKCDYWDFSYVEFGISDLPAMIEYIKDTKRAEGDCKKLTYVGHSQGTIMAFYGLSKAPTAWLYIS